MNISNKISKSSSKSELNVIYPPILIKKLQNSSVVQKKTVILEVEIDSNPAPTVEWYKNNSKIDLNSIENDNRLSLLERKGGVYQLIIKNTKKEDSGDYFCIIKNKLGEIKTEAFLDVLSSPIFIKKFDQIDGVEECEVKITSIVECNPKPTASWFFNNNEINSSDNRYNFEILKNENNFIIVLTIKSGKKTDAGQYNCTVFNEAGRASCFGKVVMHPLKAPFFINPLENELTIPEKKEVNLNVKASGIPLPKIEWFKDDILIDEKNQQFSISELNKDGCSTLKSLFPSKEFSGLYKVKALNPAGEASTKCKLKVEGYLPFFKIKPEKITCLENGTAILGCSYEGNPFPSVLWFFKNKEIKDDKRIKIVFDENTNSSMLEIENCTKRDEGTYTVIIKNIHGNESCIVSLIITTNENEVQDFKSLLKLTEYKKSEIEEVKPDWGNLKEGEQQDKIKPDDNNKINLKKVELLPRFIEKPKDIKVKRGEEAVFISEIKSSSKMVVSWKLNDKTLEKGPNIKIEKDEPRNKYLLTIKRVIENIESGNIECEAENEYGKVSEICKLIILGKYFRL